MTIKGQADAIVKEYGPYIGNIREALNKMGCCFIRFIGKRENKTYKIQFRYKDETLYLIGPYEFVKVYPDERV